VVGQSAAGNLGILGSLGLTGRAAI